MSSKVTGYLYALAAAFFWATCGVASKYCFNQELSPFLLLSVRLTLSGMILFLVLRRIKPRLLYLPGEERKQMIILGVAGVATLQLTYLFTISQLNVASAIFLQYLSPAIIALDAVVRKKERLTPLWGSALALAIGGSFLIIANQNLPGGGWRWQGIVSGLACACAFSFYSLYSKKLMRRYQPWTVLTYGFLFGAVPCWLFIPLDSLWQEPLAPGLWFFILYIIIFATIIPYGLYLKGLRLIKASHASLTSTLEPVLAGLLAYFFLGETMTGWQSAGCALIMAAVVLLQLERDN